MKIKKEELLGKVYEYLNGVRKARFVEEINEILLGHYTEEDIDWEGMEDPVIDWEEVEMERRKLAKERIAEAAEEIEAASKKVSGLTRELSTWLINQEDMGYTEERLSISLGHMREIVDNLEDSICLAEKVRLPGGLK
jgi:hypothetical protein